MAVRSTNPEPPPGLPSTLAVVFLGMLAFALVAPLVWQAGESPPIHGLLLQIVDCFDPNGSAAVSML